MCHLSPSLMVSNIHKITYNFLQMVLQSFWILLTSDIIIIRSANNFWMKTGCHSNLIIWYCVFLRLTLTCSVPEYVPVISLCCFLCIIKALLHSGLNLEETNTVL